LTGEEHDGIFASWVVNKERSDIIDFSADNNPAISIFVVFGDFFHRIGSLRFGSSFIRLHNLSGKSSESSSLEWYLSMNNKSINSLSKLIKLMFGGSSSSNSSEDNTVKKRISSESVFSVNFSTGFSGTVESGNRSFGSADLGFSVDFDSSHGVVNNGGNN